MAARYELHLNDILKAMEPADAAKPDVEASIRMIRALCKRQNDAIGDFQPPPAEPADGNRPGVRSAATSALQRILSAGKGKKQVGTLACALPRTVRYLESAE